MKSLRKTRAAQGLELQQAERPAPGQTEVLIEVKATGVCGSDLHIDEWTPSYHFMAPALPLTIGHEFCGLVAELGSGVQGLELGQLVAVRIGVMRDGAFAPWVRVPARNCVPVPQDLDPRVAALAEPLSVGWEAVRTAGVQPGDRVLVLGPGSIGQGIALLAREAGASEVVVAGHGDAARLQVLRRLGFECLLDFAEQAMPEALAEVCRERLVDVVIEASGAAGVIAPALAVLKPHGVLVVTGIHAAPVAIDLTALLRKHQQIRGSYRAREAAWPEVVSFMARHADMLRELVTHCVPLSRAAEGFDLARQKLATKVMVLPDAVASEVAQR